VTSWITLTSHGDTGMDRSSIADEYQQVQPSYRGCHEGLLEAASPDDSAIPLQAGYRAVERRQDDPLVVSVRPIPYRTGHSQALERTAMYQAPDDHDAVVGDFQKGVGAGDQYRADRMMTVLAPDHVSRNSGKDRAASHSRC
jgi:hypothetical protein